MWEFSSKSVADQKSTNFIDESARKDGVVAVSGKHKCAHCGDELGTKFRSIKN